MQDKINSFVDSVFQAGKEAKQALKKDLYAWHEGYAARPREAKIKLLAQLLNSHFKEDVSQRFFNMYFDNVMVKDYRNRPI